MEIKHIYTIRRGRSENYVQRAGLKSSYPPAPLPAAPTTWQPGILLRCPVLTHASLLTGSHPERPSRRPRNLVIGRAFTASTGPCLDAAGGGARSSLAHRHVLQPPDDVVHQLHVTLLLGMDGVVLPHLRNRYHLTWVDGPRILDLVPENKAPDRLPRCGQAVQNVV
jgi:hypothetical protein